jgi:tetratricopeptide (TPR) repeat protein
MNRPQEHLMRTAAIILLTFCGGMTAAQVTVTPRPPLQPAPQALTLTRTDGSHAATIARAQADQGNQNDPAYTTYKEGYALILKEEWTDARKKFAALLSRHPDSEYADDASYWSAYALMHIDKKKARDAYQAFIEKNSESSYYDDAVADLAQIGGATPVPGAPVAWSYGVSTGPDMRRMERELRKASRSMHVMTVPPMRGMAWNVMGDEELDQNTRLKMEALYALGENREDDQAYQTLKTIALDTKQAGPLRRAALDGLAGFTRHDVLPVCAEIAKTDTSLEIQAYAIDVIGQAKDRGKSIQILIDLFNQLPPDRKESMETVFYSIAEVGNDRAVDFLKQVALTHKNFDLRRDAVYYLGSIGGERARAALYEILKSK